VIVTFPHTPVIAHPEMLQSESLFLKRAAGTALRCGKSDRSRFRDYDEGRVKFRAGFPDANENVFYDRWRASAASPPGVSLVTGRCGGNESGPILGRLSTVPITGASSIPSA